MCILQHTNLRFTLHYITTSIESWYVLCFTTASREHRGILSDSGRVQTMYIIRYGHIPIFLKMAAVGHIVLVLREFGPPTKTRRAFGGLCHCAKFGWIRCSSFDNMQAFNFSNWSTRKRGCIFDTEELKLMISDSVVSSTNLSILYCYSGIVCVYNK